MRSLHRARREPAHLVTDARRSRSEDIAYRERRYLVMMGVRVVCFGLAVLLFVRHAGWLSAIPAVAAIVIPYFAVVFANGGREPDRTRRFREYAPNLPVPRSSEDDRAGSGAPGPATGQDAPHGPTTDDRRDVG